ncbi:MAG: ABC transporter ATP-binding protein/permease [Turicibacter sp.]|nr:ABC transporter ATP-binding protein/permease [Turicibacter sp.]
MNKLDNTSVFEQDISRENPPKIGYLLRLFKYVFSSARLVCGIFLGLSVAVSLLQPLTAFVWGRYLDAANAYAAAPLPAAESNSLVAFLAHYFPIISLVGLLVLYWLINFTTGLIMQFIYGREQIQRLSMVQDHRLQEKFQTKMLAKIARLYPDYMEVPKINDIINRSFTAMGGEQSSLQRGVMIEGYAVIARAVSVVAVAVSLFLFHPLLTIIVILAPIPTLYTTYIGNRLNFRFARNNEKILREADYYQNVLLQKSASEIKALNLFDFFFRKWKILADDYLIREKRNQFVILMLGAVSGLITNIASIAAQILAIVLLTQGVLSIGALGAVFILIQTLILSTTELFRGFSAFISKKNEAAQFFELFDLAEQPAVTEKIGKIDISELSARNVTYRYPLTDEQRISNISFSIKKGEKVAFVGENGAGKTTFIKLLTGMLVPSEGEILYNATPAAALNFSDRYNSMSYVFQDPSRFDSFTIADNVFLGDVEKARNADKINAALDFVGFNTATELDRNSLLGKDIGGIDLSGGQWQKIAIARAYYRDSDFIILDEPTSNLDPIAETEVFKQYMAMSEGKTLITVTHRISVAALADRVVVFKDGSIVEDGVHEDLLAKNGEYARLYNTQAEFYDR